MTPDNRSEEQGNVSINPWRQSVWFETRDFNLE